LRKDTGKQPKGRFVRKRGELLRSGHSTTNDLQAINIDEYSQHTMPSGYNYRAFSMKRLNPWFNRFTKSVVLGSLAPNFTCVDTRGNKLRLSNFRKSIVVLEFGCMTCAPAVGQIARFRKSLSSIAPRYERSGVEFMAVYTRETHPGENVACHTRFSDKLEHAKRFERDDGVKIRVVVDSLDGRIHRKYGMLPNMVYIINRDGRIVYKATWTDVNEVESVLDNLLLWESEGVTPTDSLAVVEKYHFIRDRDIEERRRVYGRAGSGAVEDLRRELDFPI